MGKREIPKRTATTNPIRFRGQLFGAATNGGTGEIRRLLKECGVDINVADELGDRSLRHAAFVGPLKSSETLPRYGADRALTGRKFSMLKPNAELGWEDSEPTPLELAECRKNAAVAETVRSHARKRRRELDGDLRPNKGRQILNSGQMFCWIEFWRQINTGKNL